MILFQKRPDMKYNSDLFDFFLFDLDGTLTDPGEGITASVAYALKKFGITVKDKTELYSFIGPPLAESFRDFFGFSESEQKRAVEYYREYYAERGIYENKPYEGIEETLQHLKKQGKTLAVTTSKPEKFSFLILEHFGLSGYFDAVCGATMNETRTHKADVIAYALKTLSVPEKSRRRVLMIGDRKFDVTGAKENGIRSAAVLYGYGSEEELRSCEPDFIFSSPRELCT